MSNPIPYQAIIFDMDGTAIPNSPGGMPSERLIGAVAAARTRVHLIAATGRPIGYAQPVIDALSLTDPCIISGGTIILDPVSKQITQRTTIAPATVRAMLEIFDGYPYPVNLGDHGDHGDVDAGHNNYDDVDIIYLAPVTEDDVQTMRAAVEALPGVSFSTAPSWGGSGYVVHVTPKSATKEHAIGEVLKRIGVSRDRTIGVGDGDNDLHLFAGVGHKVAMGNAGPKLQAAADEIAASQDQDGLAKIIEKYAA